MTRKYRWLGLLVATCLQGAGLLGQAHATTSVLVGPVNPKLYDQDRSVALWLENHDTRPVALQIRVLSWVQRNQADGYPEQEAVIASPPVATIAPGKKQMIRLIRSKPVPEGTEQAYRVLVDEIPLAANEAREPTTNETGIKFQMRYSVPLFVYGKNLWMYDPVLKDGPREQQGFPVLSHHVVNDGGRRYLVVHNTGPVHARLSTVSLIDTSGHTHVLAAGLLGYVLPGAEMRWPLPAEMPQGELQMLVNINDEPKPWTLPAPH